MSAWEGWYHCTGSTYGTWLRGDPRGWRARHHREHVDGDYKNPPAPGTFDALYQQSQTLMKRDRRLLDPAQRAFACTEMAQSLISQNVEVAQLCVDAKHWHALLRFGSSTGSARVIIGKAKGRSARLMSKAGLIGEGGVWAVRCKVLPIRSQAHFHNVMKYIPAHQGRGAAIFVTDSKPRA